MTYSIIFSDLSIKQLKKLPKDIQKRIVTAIKRCRIRPCDHIKRLVDVPYFRLRVGDYRVILGIKEDILRILVLKINHRKNVYK